MTKTCTGCGEEKPLDAFSTEKTGKYGRKARCRVCRAAIWSEWRGENADYILEKDRIYRDNNRDSRRLYNRNYSRLNRGRRSAISRRRRARKARLPTEIYHPEQILERDGEGCWMCRQIPDKYHVEHLIPLAADPATLESWGVVNPGDVLANVALSCASCNARKGAKIMLCALARYHRNLLGSEDDKLERTGAATDDGAA